MDVENKRVQICGMQYLPIEKAIVRNIPGSRTIQVSGAFVSIPISQGEFKEKGEPGAPFSQELKATVTDTGEESTGKLRTILAKEGLVLLEQTNGEKKVVGTDQFPVLFTVEVSGAPAILSLSFKRDSPEPSKIFKSF